MMMSCAGVQQLLKSVLVPLPPLGGDGRRAYLAVLEFLPRLLHELLQARGETPSHALTPRPAPPAAIDGTAARLRPLA